MYSQFPEAIEMTAEFEQKAVADLRKMAEIYALLGATDKESELRALALDMEQRFERSRGQSTEVQLGSDN